MRNRPGIASNTAQSLTVLSISPIEQDHCSLQEIMGHSSWRTFTARHLAGARDLIRYEDIAVVLCEQHLGHGSWIDVLDHCNELPQPPSVVVTSRLADDRLWAEALNLGAWDVLAKPFDRNEVLRSVKAAWQHWFDHGKMPLALMKSAS